MFFYFRTPPKGEAQGVDAKSTLDISFLAASKGPGLHAPRLARFIWRNRNFSQSSQLDLVREPFPISHFQHLLEQRRCDTVQN